MKKQHKKSNVYGAITQDERARAYRLGYVQKDAPDSTNPFRHRSLSHGGTVLRAMYATGQIDARNGKPMREF